MLASSELSIQILTIANLRNHVDQVEDHNSSEKKSPYHFLTTCAEELKPPLGAVTTSSCTSTLAFSSTFCAAAPRCINCAAAIQKQKTREMPANPRRQKAATDRGSSPSGSSGCSRSPSSPPSLQPPPQVAGSIPPPIFCSQSPKFRVRVLGASRRSGAAGEGEHERKQNRVRAGAARGRTRSFVGRG